MDIHMFTIINSIKILNLIHFTFREEQKIKYQNAINEAQELFNTAKKK
jgi:hypothetical protein